MLNTLFDQKNRNFLRLWLAQLTSQFGDRIHQLALIGFIAERSLGSAKDLAHILTFTILPVFFIQPFAGVIVDRLDRRTTLFVCDIIRGFLVLLIPFVFIHSQSMIPIYVIVFLIFSFARFHVPAKMSIIPDLVDQGRLIKANSLMTSTGMIAFVFGAAFGGYFIEHYGARNGFILDAVTFFVSAAFLFSLTTKWRIRLSRESVHTTFEKIKQVEKSMIREFIDGIKYLISKKEFRAVINVLFVLCASAGAIYVVLIVFIQQSFGTVTQDLGVLAIPLGVGLFSGLVVYSKWGARFVWYKTIFFCVSLSGIMLVSFAFFISQNPNIWLAMILLFAWGTTVGPIFIASNTLVQVVSTEDMRGKVFSALEIVIHFAFLVAMLMSSWISDFVGSQWILMWVGAGCFLYGGICLFTVDLAKREEKRHT